MPSKVEIDVIADVASANRNLRRLDAQVGKTGDEMTGFGTKGSAAFKALAATGALALGAQVGKELIGIAADVDLLNARISTVFPEMEGSIRSWADEVNGSFGMSVTQVAGLAAATGDLLKPIGFLEADAAELAITIAELGNAHSLWSPEIDNAKDATQILNKALLGERDGLIALGLKVSQAQVDAKKLQLAQEGVTFATDEAATAAATLALIQEQSADAMAFASSEAADQALKARELTAKWEDFKERMAVAVLPVMDQVLTALLFVAEDGLPAVGKGLDFVLVKINPFVIGVDLITKAVDAMSAAFRAVPDISFPDLPSAGSFVPNILPDFIPGAGGGGGGPSGTPSQQADAFMQEFNDRRSGSRGGSLIVNQTVQPGADAAQAGRMVVDAIEAYERTNGAAWRDGG